MSNTGAGEWHGTTILTVRKGKQVVIAGDGQVSHGNVVIKANAKKVRPLAGGRCFPASPAPLPMP